MPSLFIQHCDITGPSWPGYHNDSQFRAALNQAIQAYLSTLDQKALKKFSISTGRSVLAGDYDLGPQRGIWKLELRTVSESVDRNKTEGWMRHNFDLVPVSGTPPGTPVKTKAWTSLTWELKRTPKRVHPPSKLFKGCVFYLVKSEYYSTMDSYPGDFGLYVPEVINALGGTVKFTLSKSLTHYLGSGQQSLATYNSRKQSASFTESTPPIIDIHWIYACISLSRVLPLEPYIISSTAPFTSSSTLLLPYPGTKTPAQTHPYWSSQRPNPTYINSKAEINIALVPDPKLQSDRAGLPFGGREVLMKDYGTSLWEKPLHSAVSALFQELGGLKVEQERKANYHVGWANTFEALYAINLGATHGSYSHWLAVVATASLVPVTDSPIYKPLNINDQARHRHALRDNHFYIISDHYSKADLAYIKTLATVMGGLCSNVTENRVHIYASSYGTKIISPYAAPDSFPLGNHQVVVGHEWLEKCFQLGSHVASAGFLSTQPSPVGSKTPRPIVRVSQKQEALSLEIRYKAICDILDRSSYRYNLI